MLNVVWTAVRASFREEKHGFGSLCTPCQLTVVVPEHRLVSAVRQALVPHRHLASLVGDEHDEELHVRSVGSIEEVRAKTHRVFLAVVRCVPVAVPSRDVLTQSRREQQTSVGQARQKP